MTQFELELADHPARPGLEQAFVARHGHRAELASDGGFEDASIAVGDQIRVQGLALVEAHQMGDHGYRERATQIRLVAHPAHQLTIGRR